MLLDTLNMSIISGLALVLIIVPIYVIGHSEHRSCLSSDALGFSGWERNRRLEGHTFLTYSPSGQNLCMRKCSQYQECRSINFNMNTLECELNDVNLTTNHQDLKTRATFRFSELEQPTLDKERRNETCVPPFRTVMITGGLYICKTECPVGTRLVNNVCVCPAGKHYNKSNKFGQYNCLDCKEGHYQDKEGQRQCKECPIGHFQDSIGQQECKTCPIGHYQNISGASSCIKCAAGTSQSNTGATFCIPCAAGTSQSNTGATSCIHCAAGTSQSNTGQTSCIQCIPGRYQDSTGQRSCKLCEAGRYQNGYGQSSCVLCSPGYYMPYTGYTSCYQCQPGYYNPYYDQTYCRVCSTGIHAGQTVCQ